MAFQIQIRGEWAGTTGGWRPAMSGALNQTGRPDAEASTFTTEAEAEEMLPYVYAEGAEADDVRVIEV